MNYNDYDSNGNKKKFNLLDIADSRQKRSILILAFYLIIIIILIVVVRISMKSNNEQPKEEEKIEEKELEPVKDKDNVDELFSFIDQNNYSFTFSFNSDGIDYVTTGKRYDNKYSFTFSNGEQVLTFLGTKGNIKIMNEDGSYMASNFPIVFMNYFDNELLKKIVRNSSVVNGIYEITNEKIYEIIGRKVSGEDGSGINTIELNLKNNKVVGLVIDVTNAIKEDKTAPVMSKITLEYKDFGLIDDFDVSFQ